MPGRLGDLQVPAHLAEFLPGAEQFVALGELADDLIRRMPPALLGCHVVADSSCPNTGHQSRTTTGPLRGAHLNQTINTALRDALGDASKFDDPEFVAGLKDFNGSEYSDFVFNNYVKNLNERVKLIDLGFGFSPGLPESVELSRGTRWQEFRSLGITGPDDDLTKLIGKSYINDSYTSTSVGGKAAMEDLPVQITITAPEGMKGVYLAGDAFYDGAVSSLPSENEFLLPRGTKFKIKSVTKSENGFWIIEVEAIKQ